MDEWSARLVSAGVVEFRTSLWKAGAALAGTSAFTALGVWMIAGGNFFGWLPVAFFGVLGIPTLLWRMFFAQVQLRVTNDGVWVRAFGAEPVRWSELLSVGVKAGPGSAFVVMKLRAKAKRRLVAQNRFRSLPSKINKALIGIEGYALPTGLSASPYDIAAFLEGERRLRKASV